MNTDKTACRVLAALLADAGVKDVVVSPGSRNTPLLIALDAEPRLNKHVVIDERSAAFVALGIAQVSQLPVALACTSGSAVLNYGPALAEAFYRGLPLIAISADRPSEWIDQDDSQTIHQYEALDKIVKRSYDIPDYPEGGVDYDWFVNRSVNDALTVCVSGKPGPVHINIQLRAPLGKFVSTQLPAQRLVTTINASQQISPKDLLLLRSQVIGAKVLVVAGFLEPDNKLQQAFLRLEKAPGVAIMAETVSNLHLSPEAYSIDRVLSTLSKEEKLSLRPDIVITVGGALISRQVKEFLRAMPPAHHWSVGHQHTTVDCFRVLTQRIDVAPEYIIRKIANILMRDSSAPQYARQWRCARKKASLSARAFIDAQQWGELKAFDTIFPLLPKDINLIISNGTSIRYNQILASTPYHATFCNRGVSGIDGCSSTAVGSAIAYGGRTLLLTGDMSFTYDLSALAANNIPRNFKVIVINNQGGGIFRFVSSTRNLSCRGKYFCAPKEIDFESLAQAFDFSYRKADNQDSLCSGLKQMLADDSRPAILEVITPGLIGGDVLSKFMDRPPVV